MSRKKLPKTIVVFLVLFLVASGAAIGFFVVKKTKTSSKETRESTLLVIHETVTNIIEVSGTIEAAQTQTLTAAGDGTVTAVYVTVGDVVKKGQTMLELDKSEQEYNLAKHDFDTAQKQINSSPRELELMAYQRRTLIQKLEDRNIVANFDGVVADFTAAKGDYLEAKDTVGTLIQRDYLKAYVEVVETDAPKLQAGQKVYCTFPAYGTKIVEGEVVSYPAVGSITNRGASIVKVEIRIPNPPEIILPNYSFTGEIEISPPENLVLIPQEALSPSPSTPSDLNQSSSTSSSQEQNSGQRKNQGYVEVIQEDGSTQKMEVIVEAYDRSYFKVIEGNLLAGSRLKSLREPRLSGTRPGNFKPEAAPQSQGGMGGFGIPAMGGAPNRTSGRPGGR